MKIWLDDIRTPPDEGWEWAKTPSEAIALLDSADIEVISLDHDLGFDGERELSGYQVVLWIEEAVALKSYDPPEMLVHSANPPAHERLLRAIDAIEQRVSARDASGAQET
jgi:hypothetical protein